MSDTLDAVQTERVTARQELGLVEDQKTNGTRHRVAEMTKKIVDSCHVQYNLTQTWTIGHRALYASLFMLHQLQG